MRKHDAKLVVNLNADLERAWKDAAYLRRIDDEPGDDCTDPDLEVIA